MSVENEKLIYFSSPVINSPNLMLEYMEYEPSLDTLQSSKILQPGTVDVLKEFIRMSADVQRVQLMEKGESYLGSILDAIQKVQTDPKLIKYFVLLLEGIIQDDGQNIKHLATMQKRFKNKVDVIQILLHFIVSSAGADSEMKDAAAHVLAETISVVGYKGYETVCKDFLIWLMNAHQSQTITTFGTTKSLMAILKINENMKHFLDSNGIRKLVRILEEEGDDMQICYNTIACIWLLSFKSYCMPTFEDRKNGVVESVINALQLFRREKIVRIVLYLFKNLAKSDKIVEFMLDCELLKEINNLLNRHWVDKDIMTNLEELENILNENYKVLNNFEKFKKQVYDGVLKWGPIHSDTFWSEHVKFCEDDDFDIVKKLVLLLKDERPLTKAIACYDLGQFARYYQFGRNVLEKLKAKEQLLNLMESEESQIRENALIAIQKLMISDWQKISVK